MKILLISGIDTADVGSLKPCPAWRTAISTGLKAAGYKRTIKTSGFDYHQIFADLCTDQLICTLAAAELMASIGTGRPPASFPPSEPGENRLLLEKLRWSASMVAQFLCNDRLRSCCRDHLASQIKRVRPDVICAHDLGTLLCYDFFANDKRGGKIFQRGTLLTFGTQIANPFVKNNMWADGLRMVQVGRWYNLHNPKDPFFTAPVVIDSEAFFEITTVFGRGVLDESAHSACTESTAEHPGYLDNSASKTTLWPLIADGKTAKLIASNLRIVKHLPRTPEALDVMRQAERRETRSFGYRPPPADHPFVKSAANFAAIAGAAPPRQPVDLRAGCLPIRNQGHENSCSGFATAAFRELCHFKATGNLLTQYLSPAYLYAHARMNDNTFPADSGASIAEELSVLQNFGVCAESFMPYTGDATTAPGPSADVSALAFRYSQATQIDFSNPVLLKSALAASQSIIIGFKYYSSFETPDANGVVPIPQPDKEIFRGGHDVLVVGFDDATLRWTVRNQWGTTWGLNGYGFMPYGYERFWIEAWTGVAAP